LDDARLHADRGEWAAAEKICRALIDADSLNARAHFMLGLILANSASVDAAIAELRRAIYIDRRFALAYYHLGTLFQRTACASDSRRAFRNASALLQERAAEDPVEYGDGITAEELRELVRMHQEILGE
jgi:chemotaxis protein methyltransferase CheR